MEKELLKKQKLAKELSIEFEEIVDLFSVETLESFQMEQAVGGDGNLPKPRGLFDICPNFCTNVNVCPTNMFCDPPKTDTSCGTNSCGTNRCGGTGGPIQRNCLCGGSDFRPSPLPSC